MTSDDWFRVVILCIGSLEIILTILWLFPRLRRRLLPTGEVLARAGGGLLVCGIVYGTAEVLFHFPSTYRLTFILIGLSWLTIGLSISVFNDWRGRGHQLHRKHPNREADQ